MKPADRKRWMPPVGVHVRFQGYGRTRRHGSPLGSLGLVVLIVAALGATALFRHLPRGAEEGNPTTARAGASNVSKPQQRVVAPMPASSPLVSPGSMVRGKPATPAASQPRLGSNIASPGAPGTTTHPVTKAANSTPTTAPSKVAPGAGATGAPLIPNGGGRRYHVQAGAFEEKAPAEELATRLRTLGYAARIVGTKPYLVLVGGYLDEPTAGRLVSHLRGQGFDAVMNPAKASQ